MFDSIGRLVRTLVRPIVTVGLGAAFVTVAILGNMAAAGLIGAQFAVAMTFWFTDRDEMSDSTDPREQ